MKDTDELAVILSVFEDVSWLAMHAEGVERATVDNLMTEVRARLGDERRTLQAGGQGDDMDLLSQISRAQMAAAARTAPDVEARRRLLTECRDRWQEMGARGRY